MISKKFNCNFCNRCYKIKSNYIKHETRCEIYHKFLYNKDDENPNEEPPTNKELYRIIRDLVKTCSELKKEIRHIKQSNSIKNKKTAIKWLNDKTPPKIDFIEFVNSLSTNITQAHLLKIMDTDFTTTSKILLEPLLNDNKENKIPITSFVIKPNYIYIFKKQKWIIAELNDFIELNNTLRIGFLKELIKWSNDNKEKIEENDYLKDQEINTMIKINGSSSQDSKKANELKNWLYDKCKTSVCEII